MRRGVLRRSAASGSLLGCVLSTLTACQSPPERDLGATRQVVVGGVTSPPERDSVVQLLARGTDRTAFCTATLIAPELMVTARHCVSPFTDGEYTCSIEGFVDPDLPRSPENAGDSGFPYAPELIEFYVGQQPDSDEPDAIGAEVFAAPTDTICRNDLAVVRIDRALDLPSVPLRLYAGTLPGEHVMVVGYGVNDTEFLARFEKDDVPILTVGESEYYPVVGQALPRSFTVGRSVCPGDSGGPALSKAGAVLGVFSLLTGDCRSSEVRNSFTQLAPFASLVEQAFEAAGYEPVLEATDTGAGGAAGEAASAQSGATSRGGSGGRGGQAAEPDSGQAGKDSGESGGASGGQAAEPDGGQAGEDSGEPGGASGGQTVEPDSGQAGKNSDEPGQEPGGTGACHCRLGRAEMHSPDWISLFFLFGLIRRRRPHGRFRSPGAVC